MDKNKTISDKVFDTLEEQQLSPKPRWEFMLKNSFLWVSGIAALVTGAFASAAMIFAFQNSDIMLRVHLSDSLSSHLLTILPVLWIVSLIVFIGVASYQMQHTERGYRHSIPFFTVVTLFSSVILGYALYLGGIGHLVDTRVAHFLPMIESVEQRRQMSWVQPEKGVLAGYVTATSAQMVHMTDFSGSEWSIAADTLPDLDRNVLLYASEVGIIGQKVGTSTFKACGVRTWVFKGEHKPLREQMKAHILSDGPPTGLPRKPTSHIEEGDKMREMRHRFETSPRNPERNLAELRSIVCEGG